MQKPREIASRILRNRIDSADFTESLLDNEFATSQLSPPDRRLCQELTYGVVRWQAALDWLITRKTQGRAQKPVLQILLRLGLYQIFWLERIPPHAAVNESVELAKRLGCGPQSGFINAILRSYLREFDETKKLLAELKSSQPAVGCSHPEWLFERWKTRWGIEQATQLMDWNNTPPKTYARVNTLKTDAGKLVEKWREENVDYDFKTWDWAGENLVFELKSHPPFAQLESFQKGWFYIQDPSTLLAVKMLEPKPGETVLDLCAAPGGKTMYIAQVMNNEGRILASDVSENRLSLVKQNCDRLGITCVQTGSSLEPLTSHFDKVLLDAPCSNTGVMRRRVDLRWRIQPNEISRLAETQLQLLKTAAAQLKPGGVMVYSTCSLEPEENVEVVKNLLSEHPEFKLESERELLPFRDGVDGAFVAALVKARQ